MLRLPACFAAVILCFAPLFRQHTWRHAQVLLIGAILVPGQRTVTSILRVSGLCWERRFVNYHRVLNRAAWSGLRWSPEFGQAGKLSSPVRRTDPDDGQADAVFGGFQGKGGFGGAAG